MSPESPCRSSDILADRNPMSLFSYVVRYDSGFAPNPFYDFCTLATCKPDIRRAAAVGDWIVGCGSAAKEVNLGGCLVYAMQVSEILSFRDYSTDRRFDRKKPFRCGSRKQSCGDNIYVRNADDSGWDQRDSFHSLPNGLANGQHIQRDTGVDKVLISNNFVYFGGEGPAFPNVLRSFNDIDVCKSGIGRKRIEDKELIEHFEAWIGSLGSGYSGPPMEWKSLRGKT